MKKKDVIERYLKTLELNSQRRIITVIKDFLLFTGVPLVETTEDYVFEYAEELNHRKGIKARRGGSETLSGGTKRNIQKILLAVFNRLVKAGKMPLNPVSQAGIRLPSAKKNQKRPTEILPFHLVPVVCNAPSRRRKTGVRDRALLACLFGGGIRRSEAVKLTLDDIMLRNKYVNGQERAVMYLNLRETKTRIDRAKDLPDWAAEAVTRLVEQRTAEGATKYMPLLTVYWGRGKVQRPTNEHLSESTLYRIFKRWAAPYKEHGTFTPHSARATATSKKWADRHDPREIQEFGGWTVMDSAVKYDKRHHDLTSQNLRYENK